MHPSMPVLASVLLLGTVAACGAAPASPADNGVSRLDGRTILGRALADARAQSSVRMSGSGRCPEGPWVADLLLGRDGTATGTVTFPPDKVSVVATPIALYLKASPAFWTANTSAAGAARIGDRWVRSTSTRDSPCLRALTSLPAVLSNFVDLPGAVTKEGPGTVLGRPAVTVSVPIATVFVTTTGTALPLRVDSTAAADAGSTQDGVSFTEWNVPVPVAVPAASDSIDATAVAHG